MVKAGVVIRGMLEEVYHALKSHTEAQEECQEVFDFLLCMGKKGAEKRARIL